MSHISEVLQRQMRFDAALAPDTEGLDDRPEFASRRGQLIFEDAAFRTRFTGHDARHLEFL